jgi:peptidyl-prolyl cis-trans isomerase A (cyclophilin A)
MTTATFVTSKGSFTVTLMPEHAPTTVKNFVDLATGGRAWTSGGTTSSDPMYPGTIFHRVIDGFMIQGGDPEGTGRGGPGYTFEDEVPAGGPTFNQVGRLAMANAGPGTNGSQFFVTVGETPWLNGKHTIFGQVTDGYDVVEAIAKTPVGAQDKPVDDVVIERIDIAE